MGKVLSIESFNLDDEEPSEILLENLEKNVTLVFDGLNLNETLLYECVYLLSDNTWSTEGCYLSS